jgi:hypothetical protein
MQKCDLGVYPSVIIITLISAAGSFFADEGRFGHH